MSRNYHVSRDPDERPAQKLTLLRNLTITLQFCSISAQLMFWGDGRSEPQIPSLSFDCLDFSHEIQIRSELGVALQ